MLHRDSLNISASGLTHLNDFENINNLTGLNVEHLERLC